MRKVVLRQGKSGSSDNERLVSLLATGLERFFEKQGQIAPTAVDFGGDESVTTTCPAEGTGEDRET